MIDKILLFPYWFILKMRHLMFNTGIRKSIKADVPTICIGNITVGGTGKTPHTEMILRSLLQETEWKDKNIAVLSRGYKRKSKWFQQVTADGTAREFGDEPLQIKKKFPQVTVAVDKSRIRGCNFLAHPDKLLSEKKAAKCRDKNFPAADLIILDDAFQHRKLNPTVSIVLVDHNRPVFKDHLMPIGKLRDLPERIDSADIIIVTKCPNGMTGWEKGNWAKAMGFSDFDQTACTGKRKGKIQYLFFTNISYDTIQPVYPEADKHYLYSPRLILFSGIANDTPLRNYLSSNYKIIRHIKFPDHHTFSGSDISQIRSAASAFPTSVIMTTEKDSQRIRDCQKINKELKLRMFYVPIKTSFTTDQEHQIFISLLNDRLK